MVWHTHGWRPLICLVTALVLLFPSPALAAVTVLDGEGGSSGRTADAIGPRTAAITYGTQLRVFAYDATTGDLRWGTKSATGWSFATLDGAGGTAGRIDANVGEDQAAAVYRGQLYVVYYDRTHGDLRLARFDGAAWAFRTLDGAGGTAGRVSGNVGLRLSAVVYGGALHVLYVHSGSGDVRLATLNGSTWSFRTLDGAGGVAGRIDGNVGWNTVMSVYGAKLHAFYFWQDPSCDPVCHILGTIREATFDGASWSFATVADPNCCKVDQSLAVAPVSASNVYLVYENYGLTTQNLRARRWNGTSWLNVGCIGEPFVQDDIVGADASAVVVNGVVRVTYHDVWSGTFGASGVMHTSFDGTTWRTAQLPIHAGAPLTSVRAGGLKVFVGAAQVEADGPSSDDLVLATPGTAGTEIPPDDSCG